MGVFAYCWDLNSKYFRAHGPWGQTDLAFNPERALYPPTPTFHAWISTFLSGDDNSAPNRAAFKFK